MQGYLAKILELDETKDINGGANLGSSNEEDQESMGGGNSCRGRGRGGRGGKLGDDMLGGLTDKQTKKIIEQKLAQKGKQKRKKMGRQPPNGMTEAEMIAEQHRLFENAKDYNYSEEGGVAGEQ